MTSSLFIRRTYEPLKFLGRLFWVPMVTTPDAEYLSMTHTWEADGEQRWGPTVVVRVPMTRLALGFGVWLDIQPDDIIDVRDEDAEYDAYVAVNGQVDRQKWENARREIAALGLDPDEEMELMQEKGIFE